MADLLKQHIEERIRSGDLECRTDQCESQAFDIRVWKDSKEVPEGAAVCRECDTRIDITMSKSELKKLQKPLDELESQVEDLQDQLDSL